MRSTSVFCSAIITFSNWVRNEASDAMPTARMAPRNNSDVTVEVRVASVDRAGRCNRATSFCVEYNLFESQRTRKDECANAYCKRRAGA
jgi:hypothetical protein